MATKVKATQVIPGQVVAPPAGGNFGLVTDTRRLDDGTMVELTMEARPDVYIPVQEYLLMQTVA